MQGLHELGWFEGRNIVIEARFAKERYDELPKLARELVQLNVDLIVAADSSVIRAAKEATNKIPIVMTVVRDPVAQGYVASLARPGGNITGLSIGMRPSNGKRLEILKEAVPSVSRMAVLAASSRDRGRRRIRNCEPRVRRTNTNGSNSAMPMSMNIHSKPSCECGPTA